MTSTAILSTKNKIVRFAHSRLKDKDAWKAIGETFTPLTIIPSWTARGRTRQVVFHLTIQIIDPNGPPGNTVVAPPPPTQPPPPSL